MFFGRGQRLERGRPASLAVVHDDCAAIYAIGHAGTDGARLVAGAKGPGGLALEWRVDASPASRALLCGSKADRYFGCLVTPDGERMRLNGCVAPAVGVPLRLVAMGTEATCFAYALEPGYWVKWDAEAGDRKPLRITRGEPGDGHRFRLHPVPVGELAEPARAMAHEIARAIDVPARWESLFAVLRDAKIRPALIGPLLCRLPLDELRALADAIGAGDGTLDILHRALPDDPWIAKRVPELLAWRRGGRIQRNVARSLLALQEADLPGANGTTAHQISPGLALSALARRATRPTRMVCVLGSARNEGPYLLEWIAHHRAVGFERVFLYTNDNTDGSEALLELLAEAGEVAWIRSEPGPTAPPQYLAYGHALSVLPEILDYRWTLIADLDEFFAFDPEKFSSATDFLLWQEANGAEAVALPWLLHVASPSDGWRDAPCIERFPMRERTVNHHIKSVFRTHLHWNANPHHPEASLGLPTRFHGECGGRHIAKLPEGNPALANDPRATHAWIAHFIHRSAPEVLMKLARGKGDSRDGNAQSAMERVLQPFVGLTTRCELVRDERTALCVPGLAAELARLRAIPGVAACEAAIKARYEAEMERESLRFLRSPKAPDEAPAVSVFRALLMQQRQQSLFASHAAAD